ncbi:MAG: dihydroorotate dehydrogenase electron transfer subunit [Nitrospirae bacterium]|nr:dihydroorotate dehydrogenase electron transfer subunit [Nitrospirota bacterium]
MSRLFKASVIENRQVIKNHFLLTLHPLVKIGKPKPGNFFMISVDNCLDPLLKRPFSIHRWLGRDFQVLYRVTGKGTSILSNRKPGDILEIIGPLGNAFPSLRSDNKIIMVAGGLGIAPILGLAETINKYRPLCFYGARTHEELLCIDELISLGIEPVISTDDGSLGEKGNIVDVLNKYISSQSFKALPCLYACGPEPMLIALSDLAKKSNLKGYIALEQNMACGLGTCLGCVVNTTDGYKRVCREGPVFPINEVIWE